MGILGDYAKKWINWQNDQAEADNINAETEKKKKIIAATKKKIAAKMAPGNILMQGRRGMIQAGASEDEMTKMGFGKDE